MIPVLFFLNAFALNPLSFESGGNLVSNPLENKNYDVHSARAIKGDGVYSLLRRYHLTAHICNINTFYSLNGLSKEDMLLSGKEYKIPVYVFEYNGKSIRSTLGINNWEKAVSIKEYNETMVLSDMRIANYTENKSLWVPHHALFCSGESEGASTLEESPKSNTTVVHEKLFGENYSSVIRADERLKDHVYYIVSGHGGPDPGARCTDCANTLCEDEYAYDVALRLARDLMQHGATVEIIVQDHNDGIRDDRVLRCDYDEVYRGNHNIARNQLERLKKRADIINELYVHYQKKGMKKQRAIMIHVDSQNARNRQDVYFYYYKHSKQGRQLALDLKDTFRQKYATHQKNRGYEGFVRERSLYMLRNTLPPAVYIELANIRNYSDHKRLLLNTNRQALANWIFESLVKS